MNLASAATTMASSPDANANRLGISRARVQRIEAKAMQRLRRRSTRKFSAA